MTLSELLAALPQQPVDFNTVIQVIDTEYTFTPTCFSNGDAISEAGTNNGSCKILAFGQLHGLSEQATLNAFGNFYVQDVLGNPDGSDHQNIRNFIKSGWAGVAFAGQPLTQRSA